MRILQFCDVDSNPKFESGISQLCDLTPICVWISKPLSCERYVFNIISYFINTPPIVWELTIFLIIMYTCKLICSRDLWSWTILWLCLPFSILTATVVVFSWHTMPTASPMTTLPNAPSPIVLPRVSLKKKRNNQVITTILHEKFNTKLILNWSVSVPKNIFRYV